MEVVKEMTKDTQARGAAPGHGRSASLEERGDFLSPRDIKEIFSVSDSTAYRICQDLHPITVRGRLIRVSKKNVIDALRKGRI